MYSDNPKSDVATLKEAEYADCESGPTVYFDGSCALCTAEIRLYASRRGGTRLTFCDVSGDHAELGPNLDRDKALQRFHVRLPDGTLLSGARAFVAIWEALPGWQRIGRLSKFPVVLALLELFYRGFLWIRPALSRIAAALGARALNPRACRTTAVSKDRHS